MHSQSLLLSEDELEVEKLALLSLLTKLIDTTTSSTSMHDSERNDDYGRWQRLHIDILIATLVDALKHPSSGIVHLRYLIVTSSGM
jgi:hypothetical protein